MALFGPGKEQKAAAENEVMQLLAGNEYLTDLMDNLLVEAGKKEIEVDGEMRCLNENEWLTTCQGYYDSLTRTVVVEPDLFMIKWSGTHTEQYQAPDGNVRTQTVEDIYEKIAYAYTNNGYMPLHGVNIGDVSINTEKVMTLWAKVIQERMISLFPELKFSSNLTPQGTTCWFTYQVPALEWKDWF